MSPTVGYLVQTLVTLFGVLALAILVLFAARRVGVGQASGPMELLGRLPLEARRAVYLVKVAGRVLVLGSSEAGLTKLAELGSDDVESPTGAGRRFSDVLRGGVQSPGPEGDDP